jgi:hypothetical protein
MTFQQRVDAPARNFMVIGNQDSQHLPPRCNRAHYQSRPLG